MSRTTAELVFLKSTGMLVLTATKFSTATGIADRMNVGDDS